jgi:hypothetical protein
MQILFSFNIVQCNGCFYELQMHLMQRPFVIQLRLRLIHFERTWKEAFVAYFNVKFRHLSEGTEENHLQIS